MALSVGSRLRGALTHGALGGQPAAPTQAPSGGRRAWPPGDWRANCESKISRPDVHRGSGLRWHPPVAMTKALIALPCPQGAPETGGALRHAASGARARLRQLPTASAANTPAR